MSERTLTVEKSVTTANAPSTEIIRDWLIQRLAEQIGLPERAIDTKELFSNYGLSSADAVILSGDIERWLDRELSATLLWDFPTIEVLAVYLTKGA